MSHLLTPFLALFVSLLSLAHALPPLAFDVGGEFPSPVGWAFDPDSGSLDHELGEARLLLRNSRVLGVSGALDGGPEGAEALVSLTVAVAGGGDDLARALEHHLGQEAVPAFTRIGNAVLTLREEEGRVVFDFALIELAEGDFRGSRHVLNPAGVVLVRVYGDLSVSGAAEFVVSGLPGLEARAEELGVRVEYHHAPAAPTGPGALAAEASECVAAANPQGGFWAFSELLARERVAWATVVSPQAYFVQAADSLGLGAPGLSSCIEKRLAQREVSLARESASNLGFSERPTVFVGGFLMLDPWDSAELERLVVLAAPFGAGVAGEVVPLSLAVESGEAPAGDGEDSTAD